MRIPRDEAKAIRERLYLDSAPTIYRELKNALKRVCRVKECLVISKSLRLLAWKDKDDPISIRLSDHPPRRSEDVDFDVRVRCNLNGTVWLMDGKTESEVTIPQIVEMVEKKLK